MVANLTNSSIVSFWEDFSLKAPRYKEEYIESTKNKVMSFLDEPMVRNIVAQSETTINVRDIMDSGKVLLVKLSPQFKEVSLLIGTIIIGKLLMAAWSREDTEEDKRRQFNLYCDEYQRFATTDLKSFIDEARKFRIAITLSHQTLSQLDESFWTRNINRLSALLSYLVQRLRRSNIVTLNREARTLINVMADAVGVPHDPRQTAVDRILRQNLHGVS